MSLEPLAGVSASAAGVPTAQSAASQSDRGRVESTILARRLTAGQSAADGVAASDAADLQTNDRDADGRRPWEIPAIDQADTADQPAHPAQPGDHRGRSLDLTG